MSTTPTIHVLSDTVANQIAAGEVIERPAAVVKELLENALDAGATRIDIEFRQAGREYIRIEDNGCGMNREDALLSLQRHATSKISLTKDLDKLHSYGFRGEAIPSIASISDFILETKSDDNSPGTHVHVDAGKVLHVRDCGRAVGTTIEVSHLFHSVPARRKFLKTDTTEAAHIIQTVRLYALARPDVAFSLKEDTKFIIRSAVCSHLKDRASEVLGGASVKTMLDLNYEDEGVKLSGLIALPADSKASRHDMLTFVNGRPVDSRTLNFAITEAYSAFLVKGKYPQVVLFLTCDPSGVDVNVHPAKREIKFKEDNRIRSVVLRAILSVLKRWADHKVPQQVVGVPVSKLSLGEFKNPLTSLGSSTPQVSEIAQPYVQTDPTPKALPDSVVKDANVSTRIPWKYLGASQTGYLLYDTQVGIVVLDYKAALERIWYERILNECISQRVPSQALLVSLSLDLDPVSSALLLDHKAVFESYGFIIAEFGRHFYRIESVPAWLEVGDAEQFLKDMIAALREENLTSLGLSFIQEHVAKMAALKQVAKGVESKDIKPQVLVDDLFATKKPLISPRGRPVFFELDQAELNRRFTSR